MTTGAAIADEVREILDALPEGAEPRDAFAALGEARLFAVHFPVEYGGRAGSLEDYGAVAEAIGERWPLDYIHVVTIQGVGCTILRHGTPEQRERLLPALASGRTFASLLLSERGAGSDAAGLSTEARQIPGGGWILNGAKTWSLYTDWSRFGVCSARTSTGPNRYAGISLFIVDLSDPGVRIEALPRMAGPPFFEVSFDDVPVGDADVVGEPGDGFSLIAAAAGYERVGFDYLSRGQAWLRAAEEALGLVPELVNDRRRAALAKLEHGMRASRALAYAAVASADEFEFDFVTSAYAKYTCAEASQAVARWIMEDLLPEPAIRARPALTSRLRAAVLEAPELSISGAATDLLLDAIALDPALGTVASPRSADGAAVDGGDLIAQAEASLGAAGAALTLARDRAGSRWVAGSPLIEKQSTGHRLARAAAQLALARAGVLAAARSAQSGADAGHQAPACAAAAAEAALASAYALVQVYGAAGTSDAAPVAAFQACEAAATAAGPIPELWRMTGRRRGLTPTAAG